MEHLQHTLANNIAGKVVSERALSMGGSRLFESDEEGDDGAEEETTGNEGALDDGKSSSSSSSSSSSAAAKRKHSEDRWTARLLFDNNQQATSHSRRLTARRPLQFRRKAILGSPGSGTNEIEEEEEE